jgi:TP901 family phage tail tape measure protein
MATTNKYTILAKVQLDISDVNKQLDKIRKVVKPVKLPIKFDQEEIDRQVQLFENSLRKLKATKAPAFENFDVIKQAKIYEEAIQSFGKGEISAKQVRLELDNLRTKITEVTSEMKLMDREGESFISLLDNAIKKVAIWALGTTAIYGTLRQLREGSEYVRELNKVLTDTQIVTGFSEQKVNALGEGYNRLAKQLGATTLEVAQGALEWQRQGKSVEDTTALIQNSMVMSKLANMSSAEATEYLTSIMNGFGMSVKEVTVSIDKMVAVDNESATSVSELALALQRSSSSARQAKVEFDELVSYIATVSSVTRRSAETVGEAFKTIFARYQDIQKGGLDEFGMGINNVEKALKSVGIEIMNADRTSFRPFGEVLDELGKKWDKIGEVQRASILKAMAGVRQQNTLLSLLQNYNMALGFQETMLDSAGLAMERYGIYMDSIEAKANKFRASWESLMSSFISSDFTKNLLDIGSVILGIVENVGVLNIAFVALSAVIGSKMIVTIPILTSAIDALVVSMGVATATATALSTAITGGLVGIAIIGAVMAFKELNKSVVDTYQAFEKSKAVFDENQNELKNLADEYEYLANKKDKNIYTITRLLDIQTILNTKYGALKNGIDIYSDAINNNTDAIAKNVEWIKKQQEVQAEQFIMKNKFAYEEAKAFLEQKRTLGTTTYGDISTVFEGAKEQLAYYDELIIKGKDEFGIIRAQRDALAEKIVASENLVIEYEQMLNIQKAINEMDVAGANGMIDLVDETAESVYGLKNEFSDLQEIIAGRLGEVIQSYSDQQAELQAKAEELRARIAEAMTFPSTLEQQREVQNLTYQLEETNWAIQENARQYDIATKQILFNMMLQRIGQMELTGEMQTAAYQMAYQLASAWGLVDVATLQALTKINYALGEFANGNIQLAKRELENLSAWVASVAGDYYIRFNIEYNEVSGRSGREGGMMGDLGASPYAMQSKPLPKPSPPKPIGGYYPKGFSSGGGGGAKKEETYSAKDLYNDVIQLIRQQKKEEKELYQQEIKTIDDRIKGLKDQLSTYKEIVSQRKEMLDTQKEELEYQERIQEKNKDISKIQNEITLLDLDNSEEAKAKKLKLLEDLDKAQKDLEKAQRDRSYKLQKEALDREYQLYEERINSQIESAESEKNLWKEKMDAIDEFLNKSGLVAQEALRRVAEKAPSLYQELLNWNKLYGTGIDQDVTNAWNEAYKALQKYGNLLKAIYGKDYAIGGVPEFHHSGVLSGQVGGVTTPSGEVLAKLIKGEMVLNELDMKRIIGKVYTSQYTNNVSNMPTIQVDKLINVEGNVDKNVIGDLKRFSNEIVSQITKTLSQRGYIRNGRMYPL